MFKGFFGRIARKWWLMLVIGIGIGLAVSLPAGGKLFPESLSGAAYSNFVSLPADDGRAFIIPQGELLTLQLQSDGVSQWLVLSSNEHVLRNLPERPQYLNGKEYWRFRGMAQGRSDIDVSGQNGQTYKVHVAVQ